MSIKNLNLIGKDNKENLIMKKCFHNKVFSNSFLINDTVKSINSIFFFLFIRD